MIQFVEGERFVCKQALDYSSDLLLQMFDFIANLKLSCSSCFHLSIYWQGFHWGEKLLSFAFSWILVYLPPITLLYILINILTLAILLCFFLSYILNLVLHWHCFILRNILTLERRLTPLGQRCNSEFIQQDVDTETFFTSHVVLTQGVQLYNCLYEN